MGMVAVLVDGVVSDPWSLKAPVHAAIFGFFLLLHVTEGHQIGIAFISSVALLLARFCQSAVARVGFAWVGINGMLDIPIARVSRGGALALLAASSVAMVEGGIAQTAAFAAHRGFMCATGLVESTGLRVAFAAAQCLLISCYISVGALEAAAYASLGAVDAAIHVLQSETYTIGIKSATPRVLPICRLERGKFVAVAAIGQAIALFWDQNSSVSQTMSVDTVLTQCVHISAILASLLVLGPLFAATTIVKAVFVTASATDFAASVYRASNGGGTAVIVRSVADILVGITFVATSSRPSEFAQSEVGKVRNWIPWTATAAYVVVRVVIMVQWSLQIDAAIAYIFHFPFLTGSFSAWTLLWGDEIPWFLTVIFCIIEAAALMSQLNSDSYLLWMALVTDLALPMTLCIVPTKPMESFVALDRADDKVHNNRGHDTEDGDEA